MENTNEPTPRNPSDEATPALEDKVRAMEKLLAEHSDRLHGYEKSLVGRIADVDDDRRTTASKLQRAWQSQRDEIDDRLRRQTGTVVASLVLLALLVGVALFLTYRQMNMDRQSLVEQVAEIKQDLERISSTAAAGEPFKETLSRLTTAVDETSSALARLDEAQQRALREAVAGERTSREESEARLSSEIRGLAADQQDLAEGLESLRQDLQATSTAPESAPVANEGEDAVADDSEREPARESTYALQLIGFFNREAMLKFAGRTDLPSELFYREESYRGRPWFALIHSLHDDYASAEAELSRLPPDFVRLDPWIRPIRDRGDLKLLDKGTQP